MAYLVVEDFKHGMDRRSPRVAGALGALWAAKNAHITRGGRIERRKKFVAEYTVTGSFGLASVRSQLYCFGSADLAASMPIGVRYQRLQAPGGYAMTAVLDVKTFDGALYVIAEYFDGNVYHFYDGTRVTDWDTVAAANADFETLAKALAAKLEADPAITAEASGAVITVSARTAGTAYTITQGTSDQGGTPDETITLDVVQANVAAVSEVRASAGVEISAGTNDPGSNQISVLTVNGVSVLPTALDWSGSHAATAIRLAAAITAGYTTHGYSAEASGATVTITAAPGTGAAPNGYAVVTGTRGDVELVADLTLAGGVTEVVAAKQVTTATLAGTFEPEDIFAITINGTLYQVTGLASGTGRTAAIAQQRVWSPVGSLWLYCKLNAATVWDPLAVGSDAGFINVSAETEGNEDLIVAARYQGLEAVFSADSVTLFALDTDPANFAYSDSLDNTGTVAAGAVTRYGNNDVFYLDQTGVRSLRSRDGYNAPFVSDVGNQIDPYLQEYMDSLNQKEVSSALSAIEPRDGRYWLVLGDRVFVLSFFPGTKISAWSYYELDEMNGAAVQAIVRQGKRLFLRAGNYIYAYGGLDGTTYPAADEAEVEIELPFLNAKTPATIKTLRGYDMAGTNTWEVEIAFDPNQEDKTISVGRIDKVTFGEAAIAIPGRASMVAPKLVCRKAGAATISMLAIHYEGEDAPG